MTYLYIVIVSIIYTYCTIKRKPICAVALLTLLFAPPIHISKNNTIDSGYLLLIMLMMLVLYRGKIKRLPAFLIDYTLLTVFVIFMYLFAWLLFNRRNAAGLLPSFVGMIKLLLYMIVCWELDSEIKGYNLNHEIIKLITMTCIVNLVAVLYQRTDFNGSVQLLKTFILNDEQLAYLPEQIRGGIYTRYYGIFGYPMDMGIFFLYATAFLLGVKMNKLYKSFLILICIYLGISSGSKVFILGLVIEIFAFILYPILVNRAKKKHILIIFGSLLMAALFALLFDIILEIVVVVFGSGVSYRFAFLSNWLGALSTRFNPDSGLVSVSSKMLANYWMFGVGPVSIAGELIMDNSFYIVMHNGGIITLSAVLLFYIKVIRARFYNKTCMIMVLAIMMAGVAFNTLIASEMTVWVIYYLSTANEKDLAKFD